MTERDASSETDDITQRNRQRKNEKGRESSSAKDKRSKLDLKRLDTAALQRYSVVIVVMRT